MKSSRLQCAPKSLFSTVSAFSVFAAVGGALLLPQAQALPREKAGKDTDILEMEQAKPIQYGKGQGQFQAQPHLCGPAPDPIANGPVKIPEELICAKAAPPQELNSAFVPSLYAQLRSTEGNVWMSPYSITQAMAMAHTGTRGDTATQIAKALHLHENPTANGSSLSRQRQHLMQTLNQGDGRFAVANALCITGGSPAANYLKKLQQQYAAEVFPGDLAKINGWVKEKTHGEIKSILEKLDPNTGCVILNAVYFKGTWQDGFKPSATHKADFHVSADQQVKVDMMQRQGHIQVHRNEDLTAVNLPYKNGSSMVLIQPAKRGELAALEDKLNAVELEQIYQQLAPGKGNHQEAKLFLPKFRMETTYDLVDTMKAMGIVDAFDEQKADFSAMYSEKVWIGQIMHKATLEVDESGSVAAAATAIMLTESSSIPMKVPEIRFDQPFLVMIRDTATNSMLFMGRVNDPAAE